MKKFLAILLALLTATTVMLTACSGDDREGGDLNDDDDIDYVDDDKVKDSDDEEEDGKKKPTDKTEVTVPSVIYAGVTLKLRSSASDSSENNVVKSVPFGTKLNYISTSGTWYKVRLDGDETDYYVQKKWTATGNSAFVFTDCAETELTVATTTDKVQLYNSPFVCDDSTTALQNALLGNGFTKDNFEAGYKLTAVATNDGWVKVKFSGKITDGSKSAEYTTENPGVFYITMKCFTTGRITGLTSGGGSGVGGLG